MTNDEFVDQLLPPIAVHYARWPDGKAEQHICPDTQIDARSIQSRTRNDTTATTVTKTTWNHHGVGDELNGSVSPFAARRNAPITRPKIQPPKPRKKPAISASSGIVPNGFDSESVIALPTSYFG